MENLQPAVKTNETNNELTAKEFQKLLHIWFEEKGLESDLRSYLRLQMIKVLKNTEIGRRATKPNVQHTSLSKQAVNLILAEYLIQHQCHYTFSIFSTEVSLASIFPDYLSIFEPSKFKGNEINGENWQFDVENLVNILELVGVAKNSMECQEICSLYYEKKETKSVLSCMLHLLCKKAQEKPLPTSKSTIIADVQNEDKFIVHVAQILSQTNLSSNSVNNVLNEIKASYLSRKKHLKDEYNKYITELKNISATTYSKLKELHKDNKVLESKLNKIQQENSGLKSCTKELITREKSLRKELQAKTEEYTGEINELKTKMSSCSLAQQPTEIVTSTPCKQKHCESLCEENEALVRKLNSYNNKLLEENDNHKREIDKLSRKCRELANEFNVCQSNLKVLNSRSEENFSGEYNLPKVQHHYSRRKEHSDRSSSESNTEEIVVKARLKLKELERESQEIDKKYNTISIST